jgi:hypothetical protein
MTADPTLQSFRALRVHISKALDQAKLAYEFSPSSYAFSCLNACVAAEMAFELLSDSLSASEPFSDCDCKWF